MFFPKFETWPFASIWLEMSINWYTKSQGPKKKLAHFTRERIHPYPPHSGSELTQPVFRVVLLQKRASGPWLMSKYCIRENLLGWSLKCTWSIWLKNNPRAGWGKRLLFNFSNSIYYRTVSVLNETCYSRLFFSKSTTAKWRQQSVNYLLKTCHISL